MNNQTVVEFTRDEIKKGLALLPASNSQFFKRMYSPSDLDADVNVVVDNMPSDRLDWALTQVQNSLKKRMGS